MDSRQEVLDGVDSFQSFFSQPTFVRRLPRFFKSLFAEVKVKKLEIHSALGACLSFTNYFPSHPFSSLSSCFLLIGPYFLEEKN